LTLLLLLSAAACQAPGGEGEGSTVGDPTLQESEQNSLETEGESESQGESESEAVTDPVAEQPSESETQTEPPTTEQTTAGQDAADGKIVTPSAQGYTYPDMVDDLAALAQTYSEYFFYQSIGKSVDGREIYACVVGNPNAEHKVLLTGGIHGKEYLSSLVAMKQMEYYLANRAEGSYSGLQYAELLDTHAFYVLPMINPDGVMLALCGIDSIQTPEVRETVENIYADNLRDGLTSTNDINVYLAYNWKANANGVDLNRNFPLSNWAEVKTGILAPCFRNYKGPSAGSEPETKAVSAYVESLGEIEALLAFHTAGQVVYWDCGMTGGVRLDTFDLAEAVCEHTGYKLIYDKHLDASLNDWITLEKGVPSVTVEIATVEYPMPSSMWEEAFAQTKELWVITAQLFS
jgi:g-D-glutamyl-meso-diaminopimelate peptidase